jgi:1-acyl-sn-glycerol-3-phosphate acyltransferase
MVINGIVPRPIRFVMTKAFMNIPVLKVLMKQAHVIPIAGSKEDKALLDRAFDKVAAELEAGELVCIFPEGHLTQDGHIDEFRKGVERIITRTPVPVVPMALQGLWGSVFSRYGVKDHAPRKVRWLRPVGLALGVPVPAAEVTAEKLQAIVSELRGDRP